MEVRSGVLSVVQSRCLLCGYARLVEHIGSRLAGSCSELAFSCLNVSCFIVLVKLCILLFCTMRFLNEPHTELLRGMPVQYFFVGATRRIASRHDLGSKVSSGGADNTQVQVALLYSVVGVPASCWIASLPA